MLNILMEDNSTSHIYYILSNWICTFIISGLSKHSDNIIMWWEK